MPSIYFSFVRTVDGVESRKRALRHAKVPPRARSRQHHGNAPSGCRMEGGLRRHGSAKTRRPKPTAAA